MGRYQCDNCPEEDEFNGWIYNEQGVTVFLCRKCKKEDEEYPISKSIFKTKLGEKNNGSDEE